MRIFEILTEVRLLNQLAVVSIRILKVGETNKMTEIPCDTIMIA